MTELDPLAMAAFFRLADDPDALVYNAPLVTRNTGIDKLVC